MSDNLFILEQRLLGEANYQYAESILFQKLLAQYEMALLLEDDVVAQFSYEQLIQKMKDDLDRRRRMHELNRQIEKLRFPHGG